MATAAMMTATFANATDYYCSPEGTGEQDGSSWENAFPAADINEVLANLEPGDMVYLTEGKYTGTKIRPVSGITVIGGYPISAKGTDLSGYNPWVNKTIFDAEGKNGEEALVKVSGEDGVDAPLTTIKGITITGCVGVKDESDSYHGSAFNCTRSWVLLEDVTFDRNTSIKGGVVVPASGSKFHARHCVWTNNRNIRTDIGGSDGANNCFQPVLNGRGAKDNKTNIILEGCVMVNNIIENEDARKAACYGGGMSFQDGCCNLLMVNCLADGGGQTIKQNGGFIRTGNSDNGEPSLYAFAFNTMFNYSTSHATESKGKIISINGNAPYFLQGNIIVDNTDGASITPNYDAGTVAVGNKADIAIFTQGFSNNWGKYVPLIQSAGDNTVGGFLVATIQKDQNGEAGSMYKTSFLTDFSSDNWSAPAQNQVFEGNTTAKDGRYFILPKSNYCDVTLEDAINNFDSYKELEIFKKWFGWAEVDLSKDLFGNKRAATTYRGAYDPNATAGNPTGIEDLAEVNKMNLIVKSIGNGIFSISGVVGQADVFDINGTRVLSFDASEGSFSLTDSPAGIYIIRTEESYVKIIR